MQLERGRYMAEDALVGCGAMIVDWLYYRFVKRILRSLRRRDK